MSELLDTYAYAQPRFSLVVLSLFSFAGLLLVAIGVYSVMACTVSRQTRESPCAWRSEHGGGKCAETCSGGPARSSRLE